MDENQGGESLKIQTITEVEVTERRMADLLCAGMEGSYYGVPGWGRVAEYVEPSKPWSCDGWPAEPVYRHIHFPMSKDGAAILCDAEDPDEKPVWRLDRKALDKGMKLLATQQPRHFANFVAENEDAETGSVFVQLALFGEVVFG